MPHEHLAVLRLPASTDGALTKQQWIGPIEALTDKQSLQSIVLQLKMVSGAKVKIALTRCVVLVYYTKPQMVKYVIHIYRPTVAFRKIQINREFRDALSDNKSWREINTKHPLDLQKITVQ